MFINKKNSRTRRNDPVLIHDAAARLYGDRRAPKMGRSNYSIIDNDDVFLKLSPEDLQGELPNYETRRALIAKDSLASVEGFRVMVLLAYKYLFGMRVCLQCPYCNHDEMSSPCQDWFGSNAESEGGIFGRIDAGYSSFEAQKSTGALHAHSQLFVQCLHQHEPLSQVLLRLTEKPELVQQYMVYKSHVCRQIFASDNVLKTWESGRRKEIENTWPEYASRTELLVTPKYMMETSEHHISPEEKAKLQSKKTILSQLSKGQAWLREYPRVKPTQYKQIADTSIYSH